MSSEDLLTEIIGYIASVLTIISLIPQLVKIIVNKSAKDVALESYFIFVILDTLWLYYGIKKINFQIIIANSTCALISVIILILGYSYKNNNKEDEPQMIKI
jgi:MtN3 and saliva related transmembrane protein